MKKIILIILMLIFTKLYSENQNIFKIYVDVEYISEDLKKFCPLEVQQPRENIAIVIFNIGENVKKYYDYNISYTMEDYIIVLYESPILLVTRKMFVDDFCVFDIKKIDRKSFKITVSPNIQLNKYFKKYPNEYLINKKYNRIITINLLGVFQF